MTPADTRRQWYQEQAGELMQLHGIGWVLCAADERDSQFAYDYARLAAHFGRLALGHSILEDVPELPLNHMWQSYQIGMTAVPVCRVCGVVQRRDGKNKPCKGKAAPIVLRDEVLHDA